MKCGGKLNLTCANCGTGLPAEAAFCFACGQQVCSNAEVSSKFAAVHTYTPPHLVKKILASKGSLEGEHKQVTVMFADLVGSTVLLSECGSQEGSKLFGAVLEQMMEAVHAFDGIVNEVRGDGILALFGVPLTHEDHAVRACYAALRMQELIKRFATEVFRTHGVTLQIRVGLSSGEIMVREIRLDLSTDYEAVGHTIHLARRMEEMARPEAILISPATLQLVEGYVSVASQGAVPVKGVAQPVEVFELTGATPARSRIHATAIRGLSPFVGRDNEMDELRKALERANAGHGQVVSVIGQAGVGKSRLYWQFLQSPHVRNWLVVGGTSVSYGKATTYFPVIDLLKGYFQIEARDDKRDIREKVTAKVLALDHALEPTLPPLLSLLNVDPEDDGWKQLDSLHRRYHILDGVKRLLLRVSLVQPLIMLFEDLHWIDSETQALLDILVDSIGAARVLLLVNYRPEYHHEWSRKSYYRQIHMDPLGTQGADDLLANLLGNDPGLLSLKLSLIDKTEGNPLFIEESVRILAGTQALEGERGNYRLARDAVSLLIPSTVQTILAARIDRLLPEDKHLLQTAAIVGKNVNLTLLAAIAELTEENLRAGIDRLIAAEFLYEMRLFPELEYVFTHALSREVAHDSMLKERRMALHARAAKALISLAADRIDEHVQRVALHAEEGEVWELALEYLQRAGFKSYALHANADAADYFERALIALGRAPEDTTTTATSIDIRFALRNALLPLGKIDRIRDALMQVEPMLATLGDAARNAKYAAFQNNDYFLMGNQQQAIEVGLQGLRNARETGDKRLESELLYRIGQSYYALGQYNEAIAHLNHSLAITDSIADQTLAGLTAVPSVANRFWLVTAMTETGDFESAATHAKQAIVHAEQARHPLSEMMGWWCLGNMLLAKGETEGAVGSLERGKGLCDKWEFHVWWPRLASSLGLAYARVGRIQEGLTLTDEALNSAQNMRLVVDTAMLMIRRGLAALIAGLVDDAVNYGTRAIELALSHQAKGDEAWARFLTGCAYWALPSPDLDNAQQALDTALMLARANGARPLAAHCQMTFGKLLQIRGMHDVAQNHIESSTAVMEKLDMKPIPSRLVRR